MKEKSFGLAARLGNFVARHRESAPVRKIAGLCRTYLEWYGNFSYDVQSNGEAFVLRALASFQPRVLFDAGANVGDWSIAAREHCPDAEIVAFEISEPTFDQLVANTRDLPAIRCVNVGLSDVAGPLTIRHYPSFPALTTSTDYPHPIEFVELKAKVVTGDAFAADHGIERIDLLKIDVEGMEEQVLNGFEKMLATRAIGLVQFEYGRVNIMNHFLLRDFYELFRARGYVVGKIFPNYVDFRDYDLADEDFMGPNYLACAEDRVELRRALAGKSA